MVGVGLVLFGGLLASIVHLFFTGVVPWVGFLAGVSGFVVGDLGVFVRYLGSVTMSRGCDTMIEVGRELRRRSNGAVRLEGGRRGSHTRGPAAVAECRGSR